ncbi:MAG: S41 family peptidase, partial [Oscillospiraceae bacterium]
PVIVLVDENSASSSELFAAAVRDRQAGILIGSRTYGKGVAQIVRDKSSDPTLFADGSALKITTYRDFSEKLLTHDGVGVMPHLLVSPENAAQVAYLLSAASPKGETTGLLRLHIGTWRFYLDLKTAADDYYHKAFVELLEALPPSAALFLGTGV